MHSENYMPPQPRLYLCTALLVAAVVAASIFASAFAKQPGSTATTPHTAPSQGHAQQSDSDPHSNAQGDTATDPQYFAGGLWSSDLGHSTWIELQIVALAPGKTVAGYSLQWSGDKLVVIDQSPINLSTPDRTPDTPPTLAVVSIDHAGADPSADFAKAAQAYVDTLTPIKKVIIIAPLPGPDIRPADQDPYDWTFLWTQDNIDLVDWMDLGHTYDRKVSALDNVAQLFEELRASLEIVQPDLSDKTTPQLIDELTRKETGNSSAAISALAARSPYEVIPVLHAWLDAAQVAEREGRLALALQLHRAMGIHADALIAEAAASENPSMRALAARTISDLAAQTHDALGRLTTLAEDRAMSVRLEALKAAASMPGRRAAGVAQLVEAYPMSDAMRATYEGTMAMLLKYGSPIQADSRADRLRRMPMSDLLSQERNELVCKVLLEREDLPDDQIAPLLITLAEQTGSGPLTSLINLLATANPQSIIKREALLKTLVEWKTNELDAQRGRLADLIGQAGRPSTLQAAAAAALIRSSKSHIDVLQEIGMKPVLFAGLERVKPAELPKDWPAFVFESAFTADPSAQASQAAALDAIKYLPADAMTKPSIESLLGLARQASEIEIRFAAIRAINALPDSIKPTNIDDLKLTVLTLHTVPNAMRYDLTTLTAIANRPTELTLINPDTMEHNVVITLPGRGPAIGIDMSKDPAASAAIGYVPDSPDVLIHSPMVKPGASYTLRFVAPDKPGKYDYVCTFPGHYTTMIGVLNVVTP